MDYVVGSVAALISGNVTPSRPKLLKRALTPKKHPVSPNVTPKSELDDRSIFLSPTLQKKKDVVKKSPKRIFQNPDLDVTADEESNSSPISPKADKVKKHLKDDLEADSTAKTSPKSPKKSKSKPNTIVEEVSPEKKATSVVIPDIQVNNEGTPKKKKKSQKNLPIEDDKSDKLNSDIVTEESPAKSPKKKRKSNSSDQNENQKEESNNDDQQSPKKKKKQTESIDFPKDLTANVDNQDIYQNKDKVKSKKKNKKRKKGKQTAKQESVKENVETTCQGQETNKKKKAKNIVNPNAITQEDSESEHESDNDVDSENELKNKEVLAKGSGEESSDEEQEEVKKLEKKKEKTEHNTKEEVERTLFVGNVPFSPKCKKEIKTIFGKYGQIETIRIRTIPVKDARVTPKLAVIKNELHPERSTVNIYVKFQDPSSVEKALVENNRVLNNCHLRVTRSDSSGQYDQRRALFIGNLPFAIEDETLRAKFEKCGEIESVRIVRDKKTNAGKGFGYVNFKSADGVELALGMTEEDLTIKNRIIRVKRCTTTQKQQNSNQNPGRNKPNHPGQSRPNLGQNRPNSGQNCPNPGQNRPNPGHNRPNNYGQNQNNRPMQNRGKFSGGPQQEGAFRRIMNKRPNDDGSAGPENKRARFQPRASGDKKQRKEFVGVTADKKKVQKHKFSKGQKKKRVLSEILTK